jgi:hypothetical protein
MDMDAAVTVNDDSYTAPVVHNNHNNDDNNNDDHHTLQSGCIGSTKTESSPPPTITTTTTTAASTVQPERQQLQLIDNTQLIYHPIHLQLQAPPPQCCGSTGGITTSKTTTVLLMVCPNVLRQCPTILPILQDDITYCLQLVPFSVRSTLLRTTIWINDTYCYGPHQEPIYVNHMTTHHHVAWLVGYVLVQNDTVMAFLFMYCS